MYPDETPPPEEAPVLDEATQIVNEIEKVKLSNLTLSRDGVKALDQIQTRIRSLAGLTAPEPPPEPEYKPEEEEEDKPETPPEV